MFLTAAIVWLLRDEGVRVFRLSMGTAYTSLGLLCWSLLIGPWNVLRANPNPVSADLRRDVGIWAGVFGIVHVILGLQVHLTGKMLQYFLWAPEERHRLPMRYDVFGATNWSGLAATLLLIMLLAISNDLSLRRLGTGRWKSLQRWNYVAFGLVAFHGVIFQMLEKRSAPWMVTYGAMLLVVLVIQLLAVRQIRTARLTRTTNVGASRQSDQPPRPRPSSPPA